MGEEIILVTSIVAVFSITLFLVTICFLTKGSLKDKCCNIICCSCCCMKLGRRRGQQETREYASLNDLLFDVDDEDEVARLNITSSSSLSQRQEEEVGDHDGDDDDDRNYHRKKEICVSKFFTNLLSHDLSSPSRSVGRTRNTADDDNNNNTIGQNNSNQLEEPLL